MTDYGLWSWCNTNSCSLQTFNHVPIHLQSIIFCLLIVAPLNCCCIYEVWFAIFVCIVNPINHSGSYPPFVIIKCFFCSFGVNLSKGEGRYNHSNLRVNYYYNMEMSCSQHVGGVSGVIHSWLSGPGCSPPLTVFTFS